MKKVAFHTLGCKLNFSETSTIAKRFLEGGFEVADFNSAADVYVINTCTVTDNADKECRKIIRRAKRNNPDALVIVTGCYAQIGYETLSQMPEVDIVAGTAEKFKVYDLAIDALNKNTPSCVFVTPTDEIENFYFASSTEADGRTRAFFKIQDGCDYVCSFCTIPLARGKSRSLPPVQVIERFKKILAEGYREIILTGVNVGDYGRKIGSGLRELLERMIEIEGDFRIRISSIEPNLLTDEIIALAAESPKIARHFHIPLQSGSDKILRDMRRRYTSRFFENLILKAAERIPGVGLGIDVITGFPGETEEDFKQTYDLLARLPISYLHVFTYSERKNTDAAKSENKVPFEVRKKRTNTLRALSEKKKKEFLSSMKNKTVQVLFEHKNENGMMSGFSSEYVRVKAKYDATYIGKLAQVKISDCGEENCKGEVVRK